MAKGNSLKKAVQQQMRLTANAHYKDFYNLNSLLGYKDYKMFCLIGARGVGKSYAAQEFCVRQFKKYGRPFYWIRLSSESKEALLKNNCDKFIEPLILRKYKLDLVRVGADVYNVLKRDEKGKIIKKKKMATVLALSEMGHNKGQAEYDFTYTDWYNIIVDEFIIDKKAGQKRMFDVQYNLANTLETLIRDRSQKVRIIMIANNCGEIASILSFLNFMPEEFGRYYLKKKQTIIEYLANSEEYVKRRAAAVANLILGDNDSNMSNEIERDYSMITKVVVQKPTAIIKFGTERGSWFTVWDGNVVKRYNKEKCKNVIAMRPYSGEVFSTERRDAIIEAFDNRMLWFGNLITKTVFEAQMKMLKPRGATN